MIEVGFSSLNFKEFLFEDISHFVKASCCHRWLSNAGLEMVYTPVVTMSNVCQ